MEAPWQVYGLADVGVTVAHPSRCIVVHVADMVVLDARIGGTEGIPARRRYNEDLEQITLEWDEPIDVGHHPLHMKFQYELNSGMSGFYRSSYQLPDGSTQVLAATQFEANSARSAFPCFDEPALKAEFAVEVITQSGYQVLSNMPAAVMHRHEHQDESEMTWHFQPTPPMSTYLVAVVIGYLEGVTRIVDAPMVPLPTPSSSTLVASAAAAMHDHDEEHAHGADDGDDGEHMDGEHDHDHDDGGGEEEYAEYGEEGGEEETTELAAMGLLTSTEPRTVTVWGLPHQLANLEYAADAAAAMLPVYENAFGLAYALPKLDLVAIPDFSAGAMENWGLITYRQTALLVSSTSSEIDKRYVTKVIAHEMAHQWFGNLVTMEWWNDLWLNEGFASYLEFLGADGVQPNQGYYENYYVGDVPYALQYDSKRAAHPMSLASLGVNSTDKIESLFDPVEYERGGAVLRMLRAYINRGNASLPIPENWESAGSAAGPAGDLFLSGLRQYLLQYKFNSSSAHQLWESVSPVVGVDLPALMHDWTYQQSYPLVSVTVDAKGGVWLSQAPFSLSGTTPCDASIAWWVPVAFTSSEGPSTPKWAELNACQSLRPLIPALPKGGWVKVNARQYGYYRVNYSPELWAAAAAAAAQRDEVTGFPVMRGVDYAGLIEDSFALVEAGVIDTSVPFLDNLRGLVERPASDYSPWAAALTALYSIDAVLPCQSTWRKYVVHGLLEPFMANVSAASGGSTLFSSYLADIEETANEESGGGAAAVTVPPVGQRLLRPVILRAAGYFGHKRSGKEAYILMMESKSSSAALFKSLRPDLRASLYESAAQYSYKKDPEAAFEKIKSLYLEAEEADERDRTLRALGHSPLAVPAALEFALTADVKAQDVPTLVVTSALEGSQESLRGAWDWFVAHWEELHAKLGGDDEASRRMGQVMEAIGSGFSEAAVVEEVDAVYAAHAAVQSEPGYAARAKESIVANAKWVELHGETVCDWARDVLDTLSDSD